MGVYDTAADEGVMRVFPAGTARGAKIFAMGWESPIDWHNWTDDGSGYVELHGGLMPTFDDWAELAAGERITWVEQWFPVAGIGTVSYSDEAGAVSLRSVGTTVELGVYVTEPAAGQVEIEIAGLEPMSRPVALSPDAPHVETIELGSADVPARGVVTVRLVDVVGQVVLEYEEELQLVPAR